MTDKPTGTPPGDAEPTVDDKAGNASNVDLDAAAAKYRRDAKKAAREAETLKSQLEKANATLAEIEEAKKSEHEKAVEAAIKKANDAKDAEWGAAVKAQAIDHALEGELADRGYPRRFSAMVKAGADLDSVEDIKAAVDATLADMGWPPKVESGAKAPAFMGSPDPATKKDSAVWDRARVASATPEEINANWDKIKAQNPGGNFR